MRHHSPLSFAGFFLLDRAIINFFAHQPVKALTVRLSPGEYVGLPKINAAMRGVDPIRNITSEARVYLERQTYVPEEAFLRWY